MWFLQYIIDLINSGRDILVEPLSRQLPLWIVVATALFFWHIWKRYIKAYFISKIEWILLEVKLPKEMYKSPQAMEIVLGALYQAPGINFYEENYLGKIRGWSSLELVSINGALHFFIRIPKGLRITLESHIYSQYPSAEVHEVPDYVGHVPYGQSGSEWELFGTEFKLTKEDAYPIKTYVDYGLEENPKEEFKIDPITSTLEFLGSVGQGEQLWFQIIVMAAQKRFDKTNTWYKPNTWFEKADWKDNSKEIIDKLMKRDKLKGADLLKADMLLSPGERDVVAAVERNVGKLGFDCGIRILYLAEKGKFNGANIPGMLASLRQYNSLNLNGFKPTRVTAFEPWEDPFGWRILKTKSKLFEAYVNRGYFYPPYDRVPFTLSTEELATIYHFPGAVLETPTFGRIGSKRGEAPVNLPV
ncbi:MAG: hypothetical protein HZA94_03140 [Candidatus Vogelbacteria bacterium]|nr:hypothetical protein [Candidatus Vogelbacteria bacterium]